MKNPSTPTHPQLQKSEAMPEPLFALPVVQGKAAGAEANGNEKLAWREEARRLILPLLIVLLVAATTRLGYNDLWPDTIRNGWGSYGDSEAYYQLSKNLRDRGTYSLDKAAPYIPCFVVAPGYPFFLRFLFIFHIEEMNLVRVVQGVVDAFSAVFVFLGAWFLFRRRAGAFLAGLMIALSPYNIHYARALLTDWQASALMSAALCFFLAGCLRGGFRWLALSGVATALAILTRPILAPYSFAMAFLILFALEGSWRRRFTRAAGFLAVTACVITPWTIRNYRLTGAFIPVSTGSLQRTLMIGTYQTPLNWPAKQIPSEYFDSPEELQKVNDLLEKQVVCFRLNRYKELHAVNNELMALVIERIIRHPWRYLSFCIERMPMLWWNHDKPMWTDPDPKGCWIFPYLLGWLFALPLLTRRRLAIFLTVWLFPVYITAVHAMNHVEPRYSLAGIPAMSLFAGPVLAIGAGWSWNRLRRLWLSFLESLHRPEGRRIAILSAGAGAALLVMIWSAAAIYKWRQETTGLLLPMRADAALHIHLRSPISKGIKKAPLNLPDGFTIEALLMPSGQQRPYNVILGNRPKSGGKCQGFVIQQEAADINMYKFMHGDGKTWMPGIRFQLADERWNYLAVTVHDKEVRLYLEGSLSNLRTEAAKMENSLSPLRIGDGNQDNQLFIGWIRELRITPACMTPEEIAKNWLAVKEPLEYE